MRRVHDPQEPRSSHRRLLFVILGHISFAIGVVALVLPIVPTTPFLVLAATCYARGSRRFHDWLVGHRWFGPPIRAVRDRGGVTVRAKIFAIGSSLLGLAVSLAFFAPEGWGQVAAVLVTVVFVIAFLRMPTAK